MHRAYYRGVERLRGVRARRAQRLLHALLAELLVRGVLRFGHAIGAHVDEVAPPQRRRRARIGGLRAHAQWRRPPRLDRRDRRAVAAQARRDVARVAEVEATAAGLEYPQE